MFDNRDRKASSGVEGSVQLVEFLLNDEKYALPIEFIREISPMLPIRPVPKAPSFVEGVINLRGDIHSVIDLRKRFELPLDKAEKPKIIIVELGRDNIVGLIVDNVEATIMVKNSDIDSRPQLFSSAIDSEYIQGVAKVKDRLVIILDLQKLLNAGELKVLIDRQGNA